jgi:CRP/FNR family transcriptional regulator
MKRIACENCAIRGTSIIADLPAEKLDEFRACSSSVIYKPRQIVFHEGTPAAGLYILCHGAVKRYLSDRFGRDRLLGIAEPGDILGELPEDPEETYSESAEALTESQLCYLPRERLVQFVQKHPLAGVRLISALSKSLSAAHRKFRDLALKPAQTRMADLLVRLARVADPGARNGTARITLEYSRREIAELIGVSTETAIRLLSALKSRGIITTSGRELVIEDLEKLTRMAFRLDF